MSLNFFLQYNNFFLYKQYLLQHYFALRAKRAHLESLYYNIIIAIIIILKVIIIHETHYEKSDWSRAFNQFTIACELDMINVISAADITLFYHVKFNVYLVTKPLECSHLLRNKMASEDELCEKCIIKQLLNSVFA